MDWYYHRLLIYRIFLKSWANYLPERLKACLRMKIFITCLSKKSPSVQVLHQHIKGGTVDQNQVAQYRWLEKSFETHFFFVICCANLRVHLVWFGFCPGLFSISLGNFEMIWSHSSLKELDFNSDLSLQKLKDRIFLRGFITEFWGLVPSSNQNEISQR